MGDDQQFEYFYKFVSRGRFDPARPEANRDLLDDGTLYVARFDDDGRGEWLPLVHGAQPELTPERGFASQGDVVLRCREAADRLGATPLDRPEDVAVNPRTGNVYVVVHAESRPRRRRGRRSAGARSTRAPIARARARRTRRATSSSSSSRAPMRRRRRSAGRSSCWPARRARNELVAALPAEHAGVARRGASRTSAARRTSSELSAFANPDNLGFDADGNLWIVTDGNQPGDINDGCFACPTDGPERGQVRQFMSGPVGAEVCGCEFTADGSALFLTLQHPGEAGSATNPQSHWPDGGDAAPRPSVVAIEPEARSRKFGS